MDLQKITDKRVLRAYVAARYIQGEGIEIGALGTPLNVQPGVRVRYVDRMSAADLRREYPEMAQRQLVEPDIIDNGETLEKIPDGSLDFLVANHFLEHCENLLGTLRTHTRKLKPGGRLFYAVPNRDFTFDRDRPVTPFEHLVQDDRDGPELARHQHYLDWARLVEKMPPDKAEAYAAELEQKSYSIHFHAWDARALFDTMARAVAYNDFPGCVAHFELNMHEIICVLVRAR
jgi:predicted SAM-dependent methyltransferase